MTASLRPMVSRDARETHRTSTPLELFFDLTFVVGVSFAAEGFAQQIATGHGVHGVLSYAMVFFAIWWGWLNFTWFASAYDTDDWLYRLVTLVQMAGALVVAAGVPRALENQDFVVVVVGYVIMRLAMVSQWLRAARADVARRATALFFASGIVVTQLLWVARLALPDSLGVWSFLVLALAEMMVPVVAERGRPTSFHFGHITERYGLFTLIVLGEGVLASAKSIVAAIDEGEHVRSLVALAAFGIIILAGMWWLYFQIDEVGQPAGLAATLIWGYGHYIVFVTAGAVSAGLEVQVEHIVGHAHISHVAAGLALSVPVAAFIAMVWFLIIRFEVGAAMSVVSLVTSIAVLVVGALPMPGLVSTAAVAALLATLVASLVRSRHSSLARRERSPTGMSSAEVSTPGSS